MTGTIQSVASLAGLSIASVVQREASGGVAHSVTLPAATAAHLTTRTDNNTGVITLPEGHDIVNGKVDVYWAGGVRYGMDGIVTVNALAIDLGAGDNLPDDESDVTVANQVVIDTDFDGDLLAIIAAACDKVSHLDFQDVGGTSLKAVALPAGEMWSWAADMGIANPLTGNPVASIEVSNGDSAAAAALKIGLLYEST